MQKVRFSNISLDPLPLVLTDSYLPSQYFLYRLFSSLSLEIRLPLFNSFFLLSLLSLKKKNTKTNWTLTPFGLLQSNPFILSLIVSFLLLSFFFPFSSFARHYSKKLGWFFLLLLRCFTSKIFFFGPSSFLFILSPLQKIPIFPQLALRIFPLFNTLSFLLYSP